MHYENGLVRAEVIWNERKETKQSSNRQIISMNSPRKRCIIRKFKNYSAEPRNDMDYVAEHCYKKNEIILNKNNLDDS